MKLNIGSGEIPCPPFSVGWTNVDFRYVKDDPAWGIGEYLGFDLLKVWPMRAETVDCIFASHILEHFDHEQIMKVLYECCRVLRSGHPIRVICPDPKIFFYNWSIKNKQFLIDSFGQESFDKYEYDRFPHIGFTDMFFGEHCAHASCVSMDTVEIFLVRAGFRFIAEMGPGRTAFPQYFRFDEGKGVVAPTSFDNRPNMSYYVEATK